MTEEQKSEFKELLLNKASDGTEGILERDKRQFNGDTQLAKNTRVRELLELL